MDRVIYTAMTSAKYLLDRQATLAHNLANASTTGFRGDLVAMRAVPTANQADGTQVYSVDTSVGSDFSAGTMQSTGRSLDAAIQGEGWFAVQAADGNQAYTRAGNFQIGPDGSLQLPNGDQVLGSNGPVSIPSDAQSVTIGQDGTVTVKSASSNLPTTAGKLMLVNPPVGDLTKGNDGLFRLKNGDSAEPDSSVKVVSGTLEGSNVNVVEAMVGMIAAARQFDVQMKMLSTAEQNEQKASTVATTNG